jgi:hypothetical protein
MKRHSVLAGCLILLCALLALWISMDRTTTKAAELDSTRGQPIKVTPLTLKAGGRMNSSENGDWVNKPLIQVENISGKAIQYLVVEVSFPDTTSSGAQAPLILAYGQAPEQKPSSIAVKALEPGAKVNLTLNKNGCRAVGSLLTSRGAQPPKSVASQINVVIFADGTAWFEGVLHVRDQSNPLKWNPVEVSPSRADLNPAPLFKTAKVSYRGGGVPASGEGQCWDKNGFEMVECCGFMHGSSLFQPDPFGLYEPFFVSLTCSDGSTCGWYKPVGCGTGE